MSEIQKLLLVEDDPDIQRIVVMALEFKTDWTVVVASNGVEGLQKAAEEHPDVILLDAMMPKMDGLDTCKRLKEDENLRDVPVIFLTARSQQDEVAAGLAAGAIGYLVKPFDPMGLADEILALVNAGG